MIKPRQSRSSAASERSKTDRSSASGRALSKAIKAILSSKNYGYYDSEDGEDGEDDDSDLRRKFSRATIGSSSDSEARQMHRSILDSDVVDSDAPSIKQAVQALRLLHFRGELTADQRDILVRDTVLSVAAEKVPPGQIAASTEPKGQKEPAGQLIIAVSPLEGQKLPTSQVEQTLAPEAGWKEPVAQLVQADAPEFSWKVPALQMAHSVEPVESA
jgi:hypothetical protein